MFKRILDIVNEVRKMCKDTQCAYCPACLIDDMLKAGIDACNKSAHDAQMKTAQIKQRLKEMQNG